MDESLEDVSAASNDDATTNGSSTDERATIHERLTDVTTNAIADVLASLTTNVGRQTTTELLNSTTRPTTTNPITAVVGKLKLSISEHLMS